MGVLRTKTAHSYKKHFIGRSCYAYLVTTHCDNERHALQCNMKLATTDQSRMNPCHVNDRKAIGNLSCLPDPHQEHRIWSLFSIAHCQVVANIRDAQPTVERETAQFFQCLPRREHSPSILPQERRNQLPVPTCSFATSLNVLLA